MKYTYNGVKYRSQSEIKMAIHLDELGIKYKNEYKFLENRKFCFDFAFPEEKLAIEVEGITPSGGRHQRVLGYMKDCEKYNVAIKDGWRVLRIPSPWLLCGAYPKELSNFLNLVQKLLPK